MRPVSPISPPLAELLWDLRALLQVQGELGLSGLDVEADALLLSAPKVAARVTQSPVMAPPTEAPSTRSPATEQQPSTDDLSNAPRVPPSDEDPAGALARIRSDLGDCRRCKLCDTRTTIVFGVGNPQARLMFVGEGPGQDEDLQGEPFVGRAGQLLNKMIQAMGLRRSDVYIANIVKCRPPRNRDPEPDEVLSCEPFLVEQIRAVRPEVIVALGRYAAQTLLRSSTSISRLRGQWFEYEGIPFMPTFHPAYLLRNPDGKRAAWMDLQKVMAKLNLEDPRRGRSN